MQGLDGGVLVPHPRFQQRCRRRDRDGRKGFCRWLGLVSGCGDLLEAGPVAGDGLAGVLGEVVPQVPAVGDLDRARCAVAGAFGISTGPVPADDPRARVRREPVRQRPGLTAGQDVDRPPGGSIHQDRGVDLPAAQREVIYAQHLRRRRDRGLGQVEDQSQQRAAVHRDPQCPGQPGSGPPGQFEDDLRQ
jgi:hypothetical protein